MTRPFRFGCQITGTRESIREDPRRPIDAARRSEAHGFDVVLSSDHVGPGDAADARADVLSHVEGLTAAQLDAVPYVFIGSASEIAEKLQMCRERWGITYFAVCELDDFAPVIHTCRSASA
jgi:hypothetical protein